MADQPIYWFDTCSFTELRRTYPRSMFGPVWEFIDNLIKTKRIKSVEDVYIELSKQDDEIAAWLDSFDGCFIPLDTGTQQQARDILKRYPTLIDVKKNKSSADPFIIAAATLYTGIVVTEEQHSGGPPKVKIPDVCRGLGIECISLLNVLDREKFKI